MGAREWCSSWEQVWADYSLAHLPDIYGEGALFAFSGLDGQTNVASGYVASLTAQPYGLLWHTPRRRILQVTLPESGQVRVATNDVLAVETGQGGLLLTFSGWHTLVGLLPVDAGLAFSFEDAPSRDWGDSPWVLEDPAHGDVLALMVQAGHLALAYGNTPAQAVERAQAGLAADSPTLLAQRLRIYRQIPALPCAERQRLLNKCLSVIKANTLAAEGVITHTWSTPDRVPHRDMWLWDSVFHSWAMNHLAPQVAWEFLQSVLDTQTAEGMIPHQASISGKVSAITQPPLLAWGVWENYQALGQRTCLEYALPRLERYLEWDLQQRDANGNGLLEWNIEGNVRCRSGESGMDNSPRFDGAVLLDAVDFSTYAALDMRYVARIATELGQEDKAQTWRTRAAHTSQQIHRWLWDDANGFYYDRDLQGNLVRVRAASGFLPLLLDDLPPERLERLCTALLDPEQFTAIFPVPSVALAEPTWSTDMWRGATWLNLNYVIIRGLRQWGRQEEADWLVEKTLAMVGKYYELYGVLFEFYDARDQMPPLDCDRKGPRREPYNIRSKYDSIRDYHWTAALTACLLLEQ